MFKGWRRKWAGEPPEPEQQPQPLAEPVGEPLGASNIANEGYPGPDSGPAPTGDSDLGRNPPDPRPGAGDTGILTINDRRYASETLGPESLELVRLIRAADALMQRRQDILTTLRRGRMAQGLQLQELLGHQVALPPLEPEGP